jgi:hypothetical protein
MMTSWPGMPAARSPHRAGSVTRRYVERISEAMYSDMSRARERRGAARRVRVPRSPAGVPGRGRTVVLARPSLPSAPKHDCGRSPEQRQPVRFERGPSAARKYTSLTEGGKNSRKLDVNTS